MSSWTFGKKLAAGFMLVAFLTLLMGLLSFISLRQVVESKDLVIDGAANDLIDAESLRAAANAEVAQLRGYLLTKDEKHLSALRSANDEWKAILERIRSRPRTTEGKRLLASIDEAERAHQTAMEAALSLRARGAEDAQVVKLFDETVVPRFRQKLDKVRSFAERQRRSLEEDRQRILDAGMKGVVGKPVRLKQLTQELDRLLVN